MERSTPLRNPHTSTVDLLVWSELPPTDSPVRNPHTSTVDLLVWSADSPATAGFVRSHQPSEGIRKVMFGGQVTDEESESLNKRKPCSGYKMREMTGSGLFTDNGEKDDTLDTNPSSNNRTGTRMYQQAIGGISNISFGDEGNVFPKKHVSVAEAAKQRELSGTLDSELDATLKKQFSVSKNKELSGNDIFAPPPEILPQENVQRALALKENVHFGESSPRNYTGASNEETMLKTTKKGYDKKHSELSGNGVFKGDSPLATGELKTTKKGYDKKHSELSENDIFKGDSPLAAGEKSLSTAKLREINGNDIFADGKVEPREFYGGVRKPPSGESSISLV